MTVRIGINGFGRMGRLGFRAAWGWDTFDFVHINEISGDAACAAHLLQFDSIQGRWPHECGNEGERILVDGRSSAYSTTAPSDQTDWSGCALLIAASGQVGQPDQPLRCFA